MQELIKVSLKSDGSQCVSAKHLFLFLGFDRSNWSRWSAKNITENPFAIEGVDWEGFVTMTNGNETTDYTLSLDFAKRLSMMAKTDKGEEARLYFLNCEKKSQSPISSISRLEIARMLVASEEEKELLQKQIQIDAPKVLFANSVTASDDSILIGNLAKILKQNGYDIGQNRLFAWLRENHFLGSKGDFYNQPTQKAMELGLFEIVKRTINLPEKEPLVSETTKVTGKGQIYFVNKFLQKQTA